MPILLIPAALLTLALVWALRGSGDLPSRIVALAARRLPAHRAEWGWAMIAELTGIPGRGRRWRFAVGVLRVALFPPHRRPGWVLAGAAAGLALATGATWVTASTVPTLSVFVAALGFSLCAGAVVMVTRSLRPRPAASRVAVSVVALAGVAATVTTVVRVASAHPAATDDHSRYVVSVLFAVILTGYLAVAVTPRQLGNGANAALWWGLAGAMASTAAWTIRTLTGSAGTGGMTEYLSPVAAAATLAVSIGAATTTRNWRAGARAGTLTAILGAPLHFTIAMTALLGQHRYTLTSPYDVAAFPHSGYPDVASYVLSDALDGNILAGLVLYPVVLIALASLAALASTGLRQLTTRNSAQPTG
ncbi:hypothetical protein AB0I55_06740 [Actinocatenispora sera]|uniref:hypothetical protein n=1 Tax=Actinocatenispora sera TaxID=390989 RepID=UPI0033EF71C3